MGVDQISQFRQNFTILEYLEYLEDMELGQFHNFCDVCTFTYCTGHLKNSAVQLL